MKTRVSIHVQQDDSAFAADNDLYDQDGLTERGENMLKYMFAAMGLSYIGQEHKL